MNIDTLYNKLVATGCEIDSHESDLFVPVTPETTAILAEYENRSTVKSFNSNEKVWFDIPFAYTPWWTERGM